MANVLSELQQKRIEFVFHVVEFVKHSPDVKANPAFQYLLRFADALSSVCDARSVEIGILAIKKLRNPEL